MTNLEPVSGYTYNGQFYKTKREVFQRMAESKLSALFAINYQGQMIAAPSSDCALNNRFNQMAQLPQNRLSTYSLLADKDAVKAIFAEYESNIAGLAEDE